MDEFALIERAFRARARIHHPQTRIGNGDDAATLAIPPGMELAISTDISVAGRHWPEDMPLPWAGRRAVMAAASDLAAMGASAAWCWLGVMADSAQAADALGAGAAEAINELGMELAGGDTVQASQNALTVTVGGLVPEGAAMRRDAARAGDDLWLIGVCGLAARGLEEWRQGARDGGCVPDFVQVRPLLAEGIRLREAGVRCCVDVSDGLLADAGHLARESRLGIEIRLEDVPGFSRLCEIVAEEEAARLTLTGGEDYALLAAAPPAMREAMAAMGRRIGACVARHPGEVEVTWRGKPLRLDTAGFRHFA